jgi:hypothetical protein
MYERNRLISDKEQTDVVPKSPERDWVYASSAASHTKEIGKAHPIRMYETANESDRVDRLTVIQRLADRSSRINPERSERNMVSALSEQVVQCVVAEVPGSVPQRWQSDTIPDRSFASQAEAQQAENDMWSRSAAMTPLPMSFGAGSAYGFHGFPEMGTIPHAQVARVTERLSELIPMLHILHPQNRQFNTSEAHRAPTLYFQEEGMGANGQAVRSSGRIRQQHADGAAVYIDQYPRSHLFSRDQRILDVNNQYNLRDRHISAVPLAAAQPGMFHIEVHHNSPAYRSWETAHASGGTLSNQAMMPHDVDRAVLSAALTGQVNDRRS